MPWLIGLSQGFPKVNHGSKSWLIMVNHGFPKVFPMVILDNWLIIGYPNLEPLSPDLAAPRRRSAWKKWRKLPPPAPLGGESV